MDALSRSVQDAVKVTRDLNIRYIWVDALCIIQNESSDHNHEIAKMGTIYKNSTVTIAAANAPTANYGFLDPVFTLPSIQTCLAVEYTTALGNIRIVPPTGKASFSCPTEPLARRGWALQEDILSTRVLHYGSIAMTWHCETQAWQRILPHCVNHSWDQFTPERRIDLHGSGWEHQWYSLVQHYTTCSLTYERDRLLAIAGLAKEISSPLSNRGLGTYLAGLWENSIIYGLSWRVQITTAMESSAPSKICASTWSWISTNYSIEFHPVGKIRADFISFSVKPATESSPYGDVIGNRLVLSAQLLSLDKLTRWQDAITVVWDVYPLPTLEIPQNRYLLLLSQASNMM